MQQQWQQMMPWKQPVLKTINDKVIKTSIDCITYVRTHIIQHLVTVNGSTKCMEVSFEEYSNFGSRNLILVNGNPIY